MPEFPGGRDSLNKFLIKNIKYPVQAKEDNIQGTVYVSFVVSSLGEINNIKILRGIGFGCDEEAIRVVKKMPIWKPGKQNGKEVSVIFNLPVNFNLTSQ